MTTLALGKDGILEALKANLKRLRSFGVRRIGLFGSYVRGQQNDESDVDLLVEFEEGLKTFDNFMALAYFVEDLLGRQVEVVTKESLSPYVGPHILNEVEYVTVAA